MLNAEAVRAAQAPHGRTFTVSVRDVALHRALSYVGTAAGWSETVNAASIMVTDSVAAAASATPAKVVLVAEPTPFSSSSAVSAVIRSRHVDGVVAADEPDELASTLDAVAANRVVIPVPVLDRAATMPQLSERQLQVIAAVIVGRHNADIARELHLSPASVKRELADLYRCCGVANRTQLAAFGVELGLRGPRHR
jgi:DNA-binding NarL/FixJ family response regulator